MKPFRYYFRKVPPLRWLDDFTDTDLGQNVVWAMVIIFVLLFIAWKALPVK